LLGPVHHYILTEELPADESAAQKVLKRSQDCVLDRGVLLQYIPPSKLDEQTENGCLKIIVPRALCSELIRLHHDSPLAGHMGSAKTYRRLKEKYTWTRMKEDVWRYCRGCVGCQKAKPSNKPPTGLMQHTETNIPGQMIGLDLLGPLPRSTRGHEYLLVSVDYFSKWVNLVPLKSAKTRPIGEAMFDICCRFGFPKAVLSDNGPQFISKVWETFWEKLGTKTKHTTPYHPQTNLTERVNRVLVSMLRTYTDEHKNWDARLSALQFAINSAVSESTGVAPCNVVFGRKLEFPWNLDGPGSVSAPPSDDELKTFASALQEKLAKVYQFVITNLDKASSKQKKHYDKTRVEKTYAVGDKVLRDVHVLSDASKQFAAKLAPLREGPFEVSEVLSENVVRLRDLQTKKISDPINICKLSPFI
jgi:hypothetical protein